MSWFQAHAVAQLGGLEGNADPLSMLQGFPDLTTPLMAHSGPPMGTSLNPLGPSSSQVSIYTLSTCTITILLRKNYEPL